MFCDDHTYIMMVNNRENLNMHLEEIGRKKYIEYYTISQRDKKVL